VRSEIKEQCREIALDNTLSADAPVKAFVKTEGLQRVGEVPIYAVDALVRRSTPLQLTQDARHNYAVINITLAIKLNLKPGEKALIVQSNHTEFTDIVIDDAIADDCVWLPATEELGIRMGSTYSSIELEKA